MNKSKNPNFHEYFISTSEITAKLIDTGADLFVEKDSYAAIKAQRSLKPTYKSLRESLISQSVLEKYTIPDNGLFFGLGKKVYRFTTNCLFNSPSAAACVVLGCETDGQIAWKDENGKTFQEVQEGSSIKNTILQEKKQ